MTTTCASPQCDRLVMNPNTYCCTACRGLDGGLHSEGCNARRAERAAQREETVTEDCHRCRHWTPAQRKWHHCIHCDGTGQVPAHQEENTR